MIDNKINTLKNEIKTLQRTILEIMPSTSNMIEDNADLRMEMIAEISKLINIKKLELLTERL